MSERISRRQFIEITALTLASATLGSLPFIGSGSVRAQSEATPTLTPRDTERKDILSSKEINTWDSARSLPDKPTKETMKQWTQKISNDRNTNILAPNEIRTYDQIAELTQDPNVWDYPTLGEAARSKGPGYSSYEWVTSNPDGTFPKAKNFQQVLLDQSKDILQNLGFAAPSKKQIDTLYNGLQSQLPRPSDQDASVLLARNTYLKVGSFKNRKDQPEAEVCSIYTNGIKRGEEKFDSQGNLLLSNEADLPIIFALTDKPIKVDDPQRLARAEVRDKDGNIHYLQARVFDLWSQPSVLGQTPEDAKEKGWGSQVLTHCFVSKKEQKPTSTPGQPPKEQPQPPQQSPKTEVPPTSPPPTATIPPRITPQQPEPTITPG